MHVGERHVLTVEKTSLVLKVLNALSTDAEAGGGEVLRTLKELEKFAKDGCGRLILDLDAIEEPDSEMPQGVRNVGVSLIGGVLVVTCQVSSREIVRIKMLTRRHSLPKHLISSFNGLFSSTADRIRAAFSRDDTPKPN